MSETPEPGDGSGDDQAGSDREDDDRSSAAAELTGELPRFVSDRLAGRATVEQEVEAPAELDEGDQEVVAALVDFGVEEDEARQAVLTGKVPLVLTRQLRDEVPRYSLERLSDKSGVPAGVLSRVWTASGVPLPDGFSRKDLAWARQIRQLLEVMSVDAVIRGARARGSAIQAAVMNDLSIVRDELVLPMRHAGADDLTVAVALAELAQAFDPIAEQLLLNTYRIQMNHLLGSELAAMAARSEEQQIELAIGFVDVVGYTALSSRVDPAGLDEVLDAFEARVLDVVTPIPDLGAVKYLGDAVMLVGADSRTMAAALLELTEERDELADAPLRAGMAYGQVLIREGDYFGSTVNLAARLTDAARAWSVLADDALEDELAPDFDVRRILPTRLRGFGMVRPLAVRASDVRGATRHPPAASGSAET